MSEEIMELEVYKGLYRNIILAQPFHFKEKETDL